MKINVKSYPVTHENGKAKNIKKEDELRRSVLACLLWENSFYEDDQSIADRICTLAKSVDKKFVASLAVEAAKDFKLRHAPLLLLTECPDKGAIEQVITRPDQITELLAIYWRNGKKPLAAQIKKGLAKAFQKFDEYSLSKWNRDGNVKLRDALFLVHAKPKNDEQALLWKKLSNNELKCPETWEKMLSSGANKKESFENLIKEKQLGYLALLRNLRNMNEAGCDTSLVKEAIKDRKGADKILPFRYLAAAIAAPNFERELDEAMLYSIKQLPEFTGKTIVLVDVSGSMNEKLSDKSDLTRMQAAACLGSIVNSEDLRVFTFSNELVEVPARKGMAGVDAILKSQNYGGTELKKALTIINEKYDYSRIIVITDEQSQDGICDPIQSAKGYVINVASYQNGVGYGRWTNITGFSENVLKFIHEIEKE